MFIEYEPNYTYYCYGPEDMYKTHVVWIPPMLLPRPVEW